MSLKKKLIILNTTIMLGLGSAFAIPSVKAESISEIQSERTGIQSDISAAEQVIQELKKEQSKMNSQIAQIETAMKENDEKIKDTKQEIKDTEKDIDSLKKEIKALEERIAKREEVLKERALAFQESGGDVNYLEVLLGSSSFRELVDRVGAVAAIVEADREILSQQEADKAELEKKQEAVEKKLQSLKDMDVELKGMQSQIKEQKAETVNMKAKLEKKESETKALKQALENKDAGLEAKIASIRENIKKEEELKASEKADLNRAAEEVNSSNASSKESSSSSKGEASASSSSKGESSSNSSKNSSTDKPTASKTETSSKPSSANTGSAITAGYKYIGNSTYVFGGGRTASDIANGRFDCSAFVAWAYKQAGVNLPASTGALTSAGRQVSKSQMQPGDLVFFNTYKTDGHVGIYVGGNKFIGSQSSTGVAIANMGSGYWAEKFNGRVVRVN
ncbi:C40 family peptidase [Peribacillus butanolivorans]|uniref:C40 family peptidase n=1 Tax=Peribacillus butanolivorans TaxID=421767 RepID=UPI00167F3BA3|nr:C40 family peptidase [Peribacillus butanolivorans]QNU05845.1 peptidase [Peribacillus butanolivorans]